MNDHERAYIDIVAHALQRKDSCFAANIAICNVRLDAQDTVTA